MERKEIRNIKNKVEDKLIKLPGVTGVDINYKVTGGQKTDNLAIVVYVEKKGSYRKEDEIPGTIDGVLTDVVERQFCLHKNDGGDK